jgi:uncharacterized protein
MIFRLLLACFATTAVLAPSGCVLASPPSFDCAKATRPDERVICADPELSRLDNVANSGYQFLRRTYGREQANSVTLPLLRARQACGPDAACIRARQLATIEKFRSLGAPRNDVPETIIPSRPPNIAPKTEPSPALRADQPPTQKVEQPAWPNWVNETSRAAPSFSEPAKSDQKSESPSAVQSPSPSKTNETNDSGGGGGAILFWIALVGGAIYFVVKMMKQAENNRLSSTALEWRNTASIRAKEFESFVRSRQASLLTPERKCSAFYPIPP